MKTKIMAIFIALGMAGCASSPYTYHVEPTPLVAGQSKYSLGDVDVNLSITGWPRPKDESLFATEQELNQEFLSSLKKHLENKGIKAVSSDQADAKINISIDFSRGYHPIADNALIKPKIRHSITIVKDGQKLVTTSNGPYETKYAYFKDIAVNHEITFGTWDYEDEPRDIDLISELIVEDISNIGK